MKKQNINPSGATKTKTAKTANKKESKDMKKKCKIKTKTQFIKVSIDHDETDYKYIATMKDGAVFAACQSPLDVCDNCIANGLIPIIDDEIKEQLEEV